MGINLPTAKVNMSNGRGTLENADYEEFGKLRKAPSDSGQDVAGELAELAKVSNHYPARSSGGCTGRRSGFKAIANALDIANRDAPWPRSGLVGRTTGRPGIRRKQAPQEAGDLCANLTARRQAGRDAARVTQYVPRAATPKLGAGPAARQAQSGARHNGATEPAPVPPTPALGRTNRPKCIR